MAVFKRSVGYSNLSTTLFWRDDGPFCLQISILNELLLGAEVFVEELMSVDLAWCWTSHRQNEPPPGTDAAALPRVRPVSRLSPESAGDLLDDLSEPEWGHNARTVHLLGADPSAFNQLLTVAGLRDALAAFEAGEAGPIKMCFVHIYNDVQSFILVPQPTAPSVRELMRRLGIFPGTVRSRKDYSRLRWTPLRVQDFPLE